MPSTNIVTALCPAGTTPADYAAALTKAAAAATEQESVIRRAKEQRDDALLDEFYRREMIDAVDLANEGEHTPPKGMRTWGQHPAFDGPAISRQEWGEAQQFAADWRAKAVTA